MTKNNMEEFNKLTQKRNVSVYNNSGTIKLNNLNRNIEYESYLEKDILEILDLNEEILDINTQSTIIKYCINDRYYNYYPDIQLLFKDGRMAIIEVKCLMNMADYINIAKYKALKKYCEDNNFEGIDYVYILLTWNGQYQPYNKDFSHYEPFIVKIIEQIKAAYPNAKIRFLGIQSPSVNGGIAANYGASGPYSDVFGEVSTAYNYNEYLEKLCEREEYKDFCRYIDMKAQFDVEYNMPSQDTPVNARSEIMEKVGTNGVHPTMAGYLQIGDVFYRALVRDMSDEA